MFEFDLEYHSGRKLRGDLDGVPGRMTGRMEIDLFGSVINGIGSMFGAGGGGGSGGNQLAEQNQELIRQTQQMKQLTRDHQLANTTESLKDEAQKTRESNALANAGMAKEQQDHVDRVMKEAQAAMNKTIRTDLQAMHESRNEAAKYAKEQVKA